MVSGDEILDYFGEIVLLGQLQPVRHMADDDLGTLLIAQILVRIDSTRLVLGEEHRILHLADVMIQCSGTYQLAFGSDTVGCFRRKVGNLHGMLEGAGNCLGHAAQQAVVDVGQFDQGDIGGKAKRLFHQEEQGIGEQQQHSVDDEIGVHASVDFCQVVFCNQLDYAREITTEQGGEGLDGLLRARKNDLYGILNGLDYEEYDPQKDGYIYNHFNEQNFQEGKKLNKARLQKELGLPVKENTMLIGIVSRMTSQKGFDLVAYIMDELLATEDVQLAVLGTGEDQYQDMFRYFAQKYPDKIQATIGYSEERAHRIYASCDAFLMPSLFEPCGLSQLMSLRYGTVPIVRETGGLKDTVEAYNEYEHTGTGFSFANYNAHEMLGTIRYAISVFRDRKKDWNGLIQRGMKQDFSWNRSAGKYEALYEKLTDFE